MFTFTRKILGTIMTHSKFTKTLGLSGLLVAGVFAAAWAYEVSIWFSGPSAVTPGVPCPYDAEAGPILTSSSDIVRFFFDWGDGTWTTGVAPTWVSGAYAGDHINKTWDRVGTFNARAMAYNLTTGVFSPWSAPITVTVSPGNHPPATPAAPVGPTSGFRRVSYAYSASTTDPDGDAIRYTFDWGDGTTTTTNRVASGTPVSASKSWRLAGTYAVRVRATDSYDAQSSWSVPIHVRIISRARP
jgi:hypothetical protein